MKIIVPMAGMGKRMRPHTLTIPKPLIPIAGKPIVQRLVEGIAGMSDEPIEEIAFIIGDFGKPVEAQLLRIADNTGAKGSIYYQHEALGTAHAILCAGDSLSGNLIVAFADTLFSADFKINTKEEGIIWVHKVDDPTNFGVVKVGEDNSITAFVEKPKEFVSDLAIIGIYYFNDGAYLKSELQYLIDNDIKDKGEYQLTNALENMKNNGRRIIPGKVVEWLDCGNKNATVYTNQRILELTKNEDLIAKNAVIENSVLREPCYIGQNAKIKNAIVGPHVSIGENVSVETSVITNSIIQNDSHIENKIINNSMIGSSVSLTGKMEDLSIGDYTSTQ